MCLEDGLLHYADRHQSTEGCFAKLNSPRTGVKEEVVSKLHLQFAQDV